MKQLLTQEQIKDGVERLATQIGADFKGRRLTIVGVMTGSIVFLADLIRRLDLPLSVGVVQARSYRGPRITPGRLTINSDLLPNVRGREVLIVDDIFDTGYTLFELISQIDELQPAGIRSAVLLLKAGRQKVAIRPDYIGFEIPDSFVVGYGLDYQDAYRNLPFVAALEPTELNRGAER